MTNRALGLLLSVPAMAFAESVVYSSPLELDYFAPAGLAPNRAAAILIHGGALVTGSRRDAPVAALARVLNEAGFAVFAIDYRLAPQHPYPAALDDLRRAVGFVRAQAKRWKIDPKRIALVGIEAGGYLANLAVPDVQAVISLSAMSDLRGWPVPSSLHDFLAPLIAARGLEGALAEASPVMHIRTDAPPFLLIHGDADAVVPVVQSTHWQNALQAAGVRCNLILIGGGGHDPVGWTAIPGVRNWESEMIAWLRAALGHPGQRSLP